MSNPIWTWWFGDGSLEYANAIRSTSRVTTRRRFLVFLAAIGATHGVGMTFAWAENGTLQVKSQKVPTVWSPANSFAMMLANQGPDNVRQENAANGEASEAGTNSIPDLDMNPYDGSDLDARRTMLDDEKRKQRLQEMLENSSIDESSSDEDAPLSAREIMSDTNNIAEELSDKPPLSSTGEVDADGNRNANTDYFIKPRYPSVSSGRFVLPPLRAVSIAEKAIGSGQVPKTVSAGEELNRIALPEDGNERVAYSGEGYWPELIRPWAAPNTFSHPLYFEDRMLERHGHERWGCFQPLASGTRFFVTLPMLPYLATVQPPCEFVYSKGYYRVGSPVPKFFQRPPLERRAIIVEAAVVAGHFIALP